MSDKYDSKNGYGGNGDFKRNASSSQSTTQQDGDESKLNEKAGEYMRDLLSEKIKLNTQKFPISTKLIDEEVLKIQATGRVPLNANKYVDVFREKPYKVTVKVLVPLQMNPKFNFVGKLLGPKGNTMKHLQEETMCKMAVLGRGSMRDRQKEEELRNSLDPKYAHLSDELHVEVTAMAPPAEAHARIAYALAEVKKYMIPDPPEMMPPHMHGIMDRGPHRPGPPPPGRMPPPRMPPAPPGMGRPMPPKAKVISILDRARNAMETSYPYEDHYGEPPSRGPPRGGDDYYPEPSSRGPPRGGDDYYYQERREDRYYEDEPYYDKSREYKATARDVGTRRPAAQTYRQAPYTRPSKGGSSSSGVPQKKQR